MCTTKIISEPSFPGFGLLDESRHIYIENQRIKSSRDFLFKHLHHYETMFCFFYHFTKTLTTNRLLVKIGGERWEGE